MPNGHAGEYSVARCRRHARITGSVSSAQPCSLAGTVCSAQPYSPARSDSSAQRCCLTRLASSARSVSCTTAVSFTRPAFLPRTTISTCSISPARSYRKSFAHVRYDAHRECRASTRWQTQHGGLGAHTALGVQPVVRAQATLGAQTTLGAQPILRADCPYRATGLPCAYCPCRATNPRRRPRSRSSTRRPPLPRYQSCVRRPPLPRSQSSARGPRTSPPRRLSIPRSSAQIVHDAQPVFRSQAVRTAQVLYASPPRRLSVLGDRVCMRSPLLPRNYSSTQSSGSHPCNQYTQAPHATK